MLIALVAGVSITTLLIALAGHTRAGSHRSDLHVAGAFDRVGTPVRDVPRRGTPRHPELVELAAKLKTIV